MQGYFIFFPLNYRVWLFQARKPTPPCLWVETLSMDILILAWQRLAQGLLAYHLKDSKQLAFNFSSEWNWNERFPFPYKLFHVTTAHSPTSSWSVLQYTVHRTRFPVLSCLSHSCDLLLKNQLCYLGLLSPFCSALWQSLLPPPPFPLWQICIMEFTIAKDCVSAVVRWPSGSALECMFGLSQCLRDK